MILAMFSATVLCYVPLVFDSLNSDQRAPAIPATSLECVKSSLCKNLLQMNDLGHP